MTNGPQLTSLKAEDNGFIDGVPGHRLLDADHVPSGSQWQYDYYKFSCTCGFEITHCATAKGVISKTARTIWSRHVEAHRSDPEEVYEVGTIRKSRITWDVKIINANYSQASTYVATGWGTGWPSQHGWMKDYPWAVVIDKTTKRGKTSRVLDNLGRSKVDAMRKAVQLIERNDEFEVTYAEAAPPGIARPSFKSTLSDLLGETDRVADSAAGIVDIETTITELDEVLSLVPIITARRDELARIYEDRTVGLLK